MESPLSSIKGRKLTNKGSQLPLYSRLTKQIMQEKKPSKTTILNTSFEDVLISSLFLIKDNNSLAIQLKHRIDNDK